MGPMCLPLDGSCGHSHRDWWPDREREDSGGLKKLHRDLLCPAQTLKLFSSLLETKDWCLCGRLSDRAALWLPWIHFQIYFLLMDQLVLTTKHTLHVLTYSGPLLTGVTHFYLWYVYLYADTHQKEADMMVKSYRWNQQPRPGFSLAQLAETMHKVRALLDDFSQCLSSVQHFVVSLTVSLPSTCQSNTDRKTQAHAHIHRPVFWGEQSLKHSVLHFKKCNMIKPLKGPQGYSGERWERLKCYF